MTLPKVDPSLRVSKCNLGLWNLDEVLKTSQESDVKQFAVGQNFIRSYNMTMRFIRTEQDATGSRSISLLLYMGPAGHRDSIWDTLIWMGPTCLCILAYLGYFSVLKFRRVREESVAFEKMQQSF